MLMLLLMVKKYHWCWLPVQCFPYSKISFAFVTSKSQISMPSPEGRFGREILKAHNVKSSSFPGVAIKDKADYICPVIRRKLNDLPTSRG